MIPATQVAPEYDVAGLRQREFPWTAETVRDAAAVLARSLVLVSPADASAP